MTKKCKNVLCKKFATEDRAYCGSCALVYDRCDNWRCRKLTKAGDILCPRCRVLFDGAQEDMNRKMEKARLGKEKKANERKALETSPLRAYNPNFV